MSPEYFPNTFHTIMSHASEISKDALLARLRMFFADAVHCKDDEDDDMAGTQPHAFSGSMQDELFQVRCGPPMFANRCPE